MHIAFVTGEYPPMEGGVGAYTHRLALALRDMGHRITVYTRDGISSLEAEIQVVPITGLTWGWSSLRKIVSAATERQEHVANIQFQTAAFDMRPAIHWLPERLVRWSIPTITTFHDLRVPYLFPKAGRLRHWVVMKLARNSSGVIATDSQDEKTLRHHWHIKNIRRIPIGSNIQPDESRVIHGKEIRHKLGIPLTSLVISYFGFLNETKGAHILVESVAALVSNGIDAHLVMIGGRAGSSDPTNYEYGQQVDAAIDAFNLGQRVHWSGFVSDSEVSDYFYASDITALPYVDGVSLRRGTLMAALAHGRPIVTTEGGEHSPELDGAVVTVPPRDSVALADALIRIWQDDRQRSTLQTAAYRASQQFSWETIARTTVAYFQEILADGEAK